MAGQVTLPAGFSVSSSGLTRQWVAPRGFSVSEFSTSVSLLPNSAVSTSQTGSPIIATGVPRRQVTTPPGFYYSTSGLTQQWVTPGGFSVSDVAVAAGNGLLVANMVAASTTTEPALVPGRLLAPDVCVSSSWLLPTTVTAEIVTGGDFSSGTNWNLSSGATISGGTLNVASGASLTVAKQGAIIPAAGDIILVTYDMLGYVSGSAAFTSFTNVQTFFQYGRTAGYTADTTGATFIVDNVDGSDGNTGADETHAFASISKALSSITSAGNVKVLIRNKGQPYLVAPLTLASKPNVTLAGYGDEQAELLGAINVTGWVQCSAADAPLLGAIYPNCYKAIVQKTDINHTSWHALHPLEGGTLPLNLCQKRRDMSDLYFQDNTDAYYSSYKGDTCVIANDAAGHPSTLTHTAVLSNYTDTQLANCGIMIWANPNLAKFIDVTSALNGVLQLATNSYVKELYNAQSVSSYALLNILAEIQQGQYGWVDNGDGTLTLIVRPFDPANLAQGVLVAARTNVLTATSCNGIRIENLKFGMTADDSETVPSAPVILKLCNGFTFIQNTIEHYSHHSFGAGGIHIIGSQNGLIQYNEVQHGQNNFGIWNDKSAYSSDHVQIINNYVYRVSLSPVRIYGTTYPLVADCMFEECCFGGHANRLNFYLGCRYYCGWRLIIKNCGGYITWQQSDDGVFGLIYSPADPTSSDARAIVDQTNAGAMPAPSSSNYTINCMFPLPAGNTGTGPTMFYATAVPQQGVNWGLWNNLTHGLQFTTATQLAGSPDYNIVTRGSAVGPNSVTATQEEIYADPANGNFNAKAGSIVLTKQGKDVTSVVTLLETWFPGYPFRKTLNGYDWDPENPGMGPYGQFWPVG